MEVLKINFLQFFRISGRREFNNFHRINMSDRTDSRALIGGYACHDVPGRFSWEDGILTRFKSYLIPILKSGR